MRKLQHLILSILMAAQCILPSMLVHANTKEEAICNDCVATIDFSQFDNDIKEDELMLTVKQTLLNANKYALGGWFKDRKHLDTDTGKYYNLYKASNNSSTPEYIYRFPAAQAFGLAISLKTGAYNKAVIGVDPDEAKEKAIKMAVSVAHEHKANTGIGSEPQYKVWGDDWQAAHWAYYAGYAAWLLWDDLTPEEQELIRNMLVHEANRFVNQNALFWKTANGKEIYKGDSKIEEDSWNSELLNLTYHMMPKHENADKWEYRMIEYQLASFATPEMNERDEIVHGRKAKDWIKGYNINSDGTVINHDRVHPQYNAAATGVNTSIVNSIIGDSLPLAAKYNLDTLYSGLTEASFDSPPYRAPGGTMYVEDSAEIYYPEVSDWGYGVYDTFANIDVSAYVYGYNKDAYKWAKLHANKVLKQQSRYTDGHTYANGESLYPGNEEAITMRMGNSYMTLWLKEQVGVNFSNDAVDYPHDDLPEIATNQQRIFAKDSGYVRDGGNGDTCYYPGDVLEVKKDSPGYARESYLKFNLEELEALPEKAEVFLPVILVGDKVGTGKVINKVELLQENDWSEDTLTYNNRPETSGIVLASWTPNSEGLKFDVSQYVRKAYNSDKKLSLKIYSETLLGGNSFTNYGSSRQADPNYQPQMLVTYDNENADLALTGAEKVDAFASIKLALEGYHFNAVSDYDIAVEFDAEKLKLTSLNSENEQLKLLAVDKTNKGKAFITVKDTVENRKKINISNMQFQAVNTGEAKIKVSILQHGSILLSTEKTVTITKKDPDGSFISYTKPNMQKISTADTTVRVGTPVGNNGTRHEVDVKTYGNNQNTRQAFFKFPLPTQEEMDEIASLDLNFFVDRVGDGGTDVRFQYIDEVWDEATLQWDNKPGSTANLDGSATTIPAADAATLHEQLVNSPGALHFDITEKAKEMVAAGKTEMSIFVYSTKMQNKSIVLRTKEHPEEDTRPFINTVYKKAANVELKTEEEDIIVNRLSNAEVNVSVKNISGIDSAILDVAYTENLKFDSIESLHKDIDVEVLGVLHNMLRIKVTKKDAAKSFDSDMDLFKLVFKTVAKGDGTVTITTQDESGNQITCTKTITVMPTQDTTLNMQLSGDEKISSQKQAMTSATFTDVVRGVPYKLYFDYNEEHLKLNSIYSPNQNIIVNRIEIDGHTLSYDIEVLESSEPYILNFNWKAVNKFTNAQNISLTLQDDDYKVMRTQSVVYEEAKEIPTVHKDALIRLYNSCKDMQQKEYTDKSWTAFQKAMAAAKDVIDDADADQKTVDNAWKLLKEKLDELQINQPPKEDQPSQEPSEKEPPKEPVTPDKPILPDKDTTGNPELNRKEPQVKDGVPTGDTTNVNAMLITALLGFGAAVMILKKKKGEKKDTHEAEG